MLTVFFFREEHPPKCTLSLNIKISGNYHRVNIYFFSGESSLDFSTLLLKVTCKKLLLWQTCTAVRLVWLSISFSKVPNYLALCLLFYRRNGWRIFVKIKPHNKTYTLWIACFIWIESIRPIFLFYLFYNYYLTQLWRSVRDPINLN